MLRVLRALFPALVSAFRTLGVTSFSRTWHDTSLRRAFRPFLQPDPRTDPARVVGAEGVAASTPSRGETIIEEMKGGRTSTSWPAVLDRARAIMATYDTGVTLRQLFYRLVAEQVLPNTPVAYRTLSARTAEARREGTFPDFVDETRSIERMLSFPTPEAVLEAAVPLYHRDRTKGQRESLYLGVEKRGLRLQLRWFEDLGVAVLAVAGYSSETYIDAIKRDGEGQGRPASLIYAGDFDPSGEDILRDFLARTGCFDLPVAMGKAGDPRAAGFIENHGALEQVELDALPPTTLRDLYRDAVRRHWNERKYKAELALEAEERASLERFIESYKY